MEAFLPVTRYAAMSDLESGSANPFLRSRAVGVAHSILSSSVICSTVISLPGYPKSVPNWSADGAAFAEQIVSRQLTCPFIFDRAGEERSPEGKAFHLPVG